MEYVEPPAPRVLQHHLFYLQAILALTEKDKELLYLFPTTCGGGLSLVFRYLVRAPWWIRGSGSHPDDR